jgi:hypothetical protein
MGDVNIRFTSDIVKKDVPDGKYTVPLFFSACANAFLTPSVSSFLPSPTAPKSFTL